MPKTRERQAEACASCGTLTDEDELEPCAECGRYTCLECLQRGLAGYTCKACRGER